MREIEFRGKLINSGKWAYGNLDIKKTGTAIITPDNTVIGTYGKVIPETIGQYTGLKDKNGKKIYEGDIVKAFYFETEVIGKIEFIYGTFALTNSAISDNQLFIFENLEVIGNIWDNPELLKEEL